MTNSIVRLCATGPSGTHATVNCEWDQYIFEMFANSHTHSSATHTDTCSYEAMRYMAFVSLGESVAGEDKEDAPAASAADADAARRLCAGFACSRSPGRDRAAEEEALSLHTLHAGQVATCFSSFFPPHIC